MPSPDVRGGAWEAADQPHTPSEIMGRGPGSRKSKSFFQNTEESTILSLIDSYPDLLLEVFRELHAEHYTTMVVREGEDGETREVEVPEVLSDDRLRDEYPVIVAWERMHQDQVDHRPSVDGFSIKSAVGAREEDRRKPKEESSAGSERPGDNGGRVAGEQRGGWR